MNPCNIYGCHDGYRNDHIILGYDAVLFGTQALTTCIHLQVRIMNVYSEIGGGKRYVSTKLFSSTSQTTAIFTDYFVIVVPFILMIG
jgi:hypothetical protein